MIDLLRGGKVQLEPSTAGKQEGWLSLHTHTDMAIVPRQRTSMRSVSKFLTDALHLHVMRLVEAAAPAIVDILSGRLTQNLRMKVPQEVH